ncbi:putative periplasmic-binding protein [Rhodovulum sp. PH10]|nr:putative periplasmic-binding protein [Rhodovulum sp. PH10]
MPTGRLRVAIAVGATPSAAFAVRDAAGALHGVTVDLAAALADELGVPVEWLAYRSSGEIQNAAARGAWDLAFMPVDAQRRQVVAFGAAYHLMRASYLVPAGSPIKRIADADAPWVRIAGVRDTATLRASALASPRAVHLALDSSEDAVTLMTSGGADAIALGRESLAATSARIAGARVLDGAFLEARTAVAVPRGRPVALALVSGFVEQAKATGRVRRWLDAAGLTEASVAPPGMGG